MENTVCLCLMPLFNTLPNNNHRCRLSHNLWLVKTIQDETEYYDIITDDGDICGCDGECYKIINQTFEDVTLLSESSETENFQFTLSKQEFDVVV